ncbi:hypothetical protein Q9966_009287 [Columba livia]|nr:hypothetical protein Q9966_009287 [Columba livia]
MHCQVSVLYFARSAELAGLRSETLSVPRRITARQLWDEIVRVHPSESGPERALGVHCKDFCSAGVLWEHGQKSTLRLRLRLAVIRDQVVFAVQQEYVLLGDQLLVLQPGDEVAIIPPISGG